jgi:hypothetical protein
MSFQGLDPEVVGQTADGMERQAATLDGIARHVDTLIRTAMHHWSGAEAQDFHQWWVGQHRPRVLAAAQGLHSAAASVRRQVAEQERASGHPGSAPAGGGGPSLGGMVAGGLLAFGASFREAWNSPIPSKLRDLEGLAEGVFQIRHGDKADEFAFKTPGFKAISRGLTFLGVGMNAVDAFDGFSHHDGGKVTTGVGGLALTGLAVAGGAAAAPVAVPGAAVVAVASTVMPVNNEEYGNAYDDALRRNFGSSYDPSNPTQEQAAWGMKRYEGVGGFFNSIGDGVRSKADRWWGLRG